MPTPTELIVAAQARLTHAADDLSAAQSLLDQARGGLAPQLYTLTVTAGSGDGNYEAGTVVPITADAPPSGQVFDKWTGQVAEASLASTRVTMPPSNLEVVATYRAAAPLPGPGTRITRLAHLGSFTVPKIGNSDADGYPYGGGALGFNPARNSLFIAGFNVAGKVGEISIPAYGQRAVSLQNPVDPFGGKLASINPGSGNQKSVGGTLVDGETLVLSAYDTYDGTGSQVVSHFRRPLNLGSAPSTVMGPYRVGPLGAGFYSGYMAEVPAAWRDRFRGRALTGNACISIISRSSYGPSVAAFDPSVAAQTAVELVGYPDAHQTLGPWNKANQYFGGSDVVKGVVMPAGFTSVLFFGRHGTTFCYGGGTECGDPTNDYKGSHGYPYRAVCWAYDADDLASVAAGTKAPWDIKPYAMFDVPNVTSQATLVGAAHDPATGRIFVSEYMGDGALPLIHVYQAKG